MKNVEEHKQTSAFIALVSVLVLLIAGMMRDMRKSEQRPLCNFVGVAVRYPNAYVWFVFMSALDIILTCVILNLEGGGEVNPIAARVIEHTDLWGVVIFKFSLVILVIFIAEYIGRRNDRLGRRIAEWSIAITCIPVVFAIVLLWNAL